MTMQTPESPRGSPFIPLLIVLVALVVLEGAQMVSGIRDRGILNTARDGQDTALKESERMRQQLETLAGKTATLADRGDADAKFIVGEFAKRGVSLVQPKETVPAAATPSK